MVRLEDQRILRDPNPPPPVVIRAATPTLPAVVAPPPPSDLLRAARRCRGARAPARRAGARPRRPARGGGAARQGAWRRRAGSAADGGVRARADRLAGRPSGAVAGADRHRRRGSGPCRRGSRPDWRQDRRARPSATMVRRHVEAGALSGVQPDDLDVIRWRRPSRRCGSASSPWPASASYEPIAAAVLGADGQPVSRWWPIAYALQRVGDPRAAPALLALLSTPGRYTASFAVRGLAAAKATQSRGVRCASWWSSRAMPASMIQAIRALAALGDRRVAAARHARRQRRPGSIRPSALEAMTALAALADARTRGHPRGARGRCGPGGARAGDARAGARGRRHLHRDAFGARCRPRLDGARGAGRRSGHAAREPGLRAPRGDGRRQRPARRPGRARGARGIESAGRGRPDSRAAHEPRLRGPFRRGAGAGAAQGHRGRARFARGLHGRRRRIRPTWRARRVLAALAQLDPAGTRPLLDDALKDKDWARARARRGPAEGAERH